MLVSAVHYSSEVLGVLGDGKLGVEAVGWETAVVKIVAVAANIVRERMGCASPSLPDMLAGILHKWLKSGENERVRNINARRV